MGNALLFTVFLSIFATGCSSVFVLKSDPVQADVYVLNAATGEKKSIGKTPLEMSPATLRQMAGENVLSGGYFTVVIEKKDYVPSQYVLPASRFGTLVTSLDVKLKPGDQEKEVKLAQDVLDHLFLAQKMALLQQYERAQIELDKIIAEYPEFPRALSMRASILYMQKNYKESLKWYDEALKFDPKMEDAIKMSAKIRQLEGLPAREPASDSGATAPKAAAP